MNVGVDVDDGGIYKRGSLPVLLILFFKAFKSFSCFCRGGIFVEKMAKMTDSPLFIPFITPLLITFLCDQDCMVLGFSTFRVLLGFYEAVYVTTNYILRRGVCYDAVYIMTRCMLRRGVYYDTVYITTWYILRRGVCYDVLYVTTIYMLRRVICYDAVYIITRCM